MKKNLKYIWIVLCCVVVLGAVFFIVVCNRVKKQEKQGSVFMNYENTDGEINKYDEMIKSEEYIKQIENTLFKLNLPKEWNLEEIDNSENQNAKFELKLYKESKEKSASLFYYNEMFGVCGTELISKKINLDNGKEASVGYYDGGNIWDFVAFGNINPNIAILNNGLDEENANELLGIIKTLDLINKQENTFEILFYDKEQQNKKIDTILEKNEIDKYNYNIYTYGGNVNIRIDGKDYSLKEAILENKITMEEIIVKANKDLEENKITGDMFKDGGTMIYKYDNYTIIKCHTLGGNRDVYIGNEEMTINDISI